MLVLRVIEIIKTELLTHILKTITRVKLSLYNNRLFILY